MLYFDERKRDYFPRICAMGNPKAANDMILQLAAAILSRPTFQHSACGKSATQAIDEAAKAVEHMMRTVTGEDESKGTVDDLLGRAENVLDS